MAHQAVRICVREYSIDFREGEKINEKALKALFRAAVALNKSKKA